MTTSPHAIKEAILIYYWWARRVILEKYPNLDLVTFPDGITKEDWVSLYLIWAIQQKVLHVFGDPQPKAMVLVRRFKTDKIDYYKTDYSGRLMEQDPGGEIAFVDFCYAPYSYPFIIKFLKSLGTESIAWTRASTGQAYIVKSEKMHEFSFRN